jgi:hypothetical protein
MHVTVKALLKLKDQVKALVETPAVAKATP